MVTTVKDENEHILGYIEWRQVGPSGYDVEGGRYVWINDMWIHPDYQRSNVLTELIEDVLNKSNGAEFTYFTRHKYGDRMSKLYTRKQFEKYVRKVEKRWEVQK